MRKVSLLLLGCLILYVHADSDHCSHLVSVGHYDTGYDLYPGYREVNVTIGGESHVTRDPTHISYFGGLCSDTIAIITNHMSGYGTCRYYYSTLEVYLDGSFVTYIYLDGCDLATNYVHISPTMEEPEKITTDILTILAYGVGFIVLIFLSVFVVVQWNKKMLPDPNKPKVGEEGEGLLGTKNDIPSPIDVDYSAPYPELLACYDSTGNHLIRLDGRKERKSSSLYESSQGEDSYYSVGSSEISL